MLADPAYADLVHQIGIASLTADDKQIWHLTKVYWWVGGRGKRVQGALAATPLYAARLACSPCCSTGACMAALVLCSRSIL